MRSGLRSIGYGAPLVVFTVLASFGLANMVQRKYDKQDKGQLLTGSKHAAQRSAAKAKEFSLEEELASMKKQLDLSAWNSVPMPKEDDPIADPVLTKKPSAEEEAG